MTRAFDAPCDLAVIGAGPAGMAAARVAAEAGARPVDPAGPESVRH